MKQNTLINDLTTGSVTKQLIYFSLPFLLSNLLQTLYNLVDMIVVGHFVGSVGLSAVSIGGQVSFMLTALCMGFAGGGQILISQQVGAGEKEGISRTIGTMFTTILAMSLVFTAVGIIFCNFLLTAMNTPAEAMKQASDYMIISSCGMFFIYGYNVVCAILRGMGDSKRPLLFIAIAAVINLVLDLVFVAGMGMESAGSAYATVIGQAVSFIISIAYLYRRKEALGFDFKLKSFAVDISKLKPLARLGFPLALQICAIMISFAFVNAFINAYGVVASAVTGIGQRLMSLIAIMTQSIGTAGAAMIGQNMGAGKLDRSKKIVYISLALCVGFGLLVCVLCYIFPRQLFGFFSSDEAVLAMAPGYMIYLIISFISAALMTPYNEMINGIGFASLGLVIGLIDGVVARIGLSLIFGIALDMGLHGYWLGNALAGFVTLFIAAAYFYTGRWKTRKLLTSK